MEDPSGGKRKRRDDDDEASEDAAATSAVVEEEGVEKEEAGKAVAVAVAETETEMETDTTAAAAAAAAATAENADADVAGEVVERKGNEKAAPPEQTKGKVSKKQNSAELLAIPRNAIKRVMKLDDDVKQVQHEAVVLVGKATELFLAKLAAKAYAHADEGGRRQLAYKDVVKARMDDPNLQFLKNIIPEEGAPAGPY